MLAFDLDPGPPADVLDCCRVALRLRELFGHFDVECFPKTSGSKGLQVYVPLNTEGQLRRDQTVRQSDRPAARKADARGGRLEDEKGRTQGQGLRRLVAEPPRKTTIAVYSLRARERPTASTPITWDEVERAAESGDGRSLVFEAGDVLERVEQHGDLFAPVLELKQELPDSS